MEHYEKATTNDTFQFTPDENCWQNKIKPVKIDLTGTQHLKAKMDTYTDNESTFVDTAMSNVAVYPEVSSCLVGGVVISET